MEICLIICLIIVIYIAYKIDKNNKDKKKAKKENNSNNTIEEFIKKSGTKNILANASIKKAQEMLQSDENVLYAVNTNILIIDNIKTTLNSVNSMFSLKNSISGVLTITDKRVFFCSSIIGNINQKQIFIKDITSIDENFNTLMGRGQIRLKGLTETFVINVYKKDIANNIKSYIYNAQKIIESKKNTNDIKSNSYNKSSAEPNFLNDFSNDYLNTKLEDGMTIKEHMIKDYNNEIEYEENSPNPKFHRTFEEGELSFEFSQQYSENIDKLENIIYEGINYSQSNLEEIKQSIEKCNRSIEAYYELKRFCYKHKGGRIYFQDMWECCHNSKNTCFEYVEQLNDVKNHLLNLYNKKNIGSNN